MTIEFTCACGQRLRAKTEDIGRLMRCPTCGREMTVPNQATSVQAAEGAPLPAREETTARRRDREERDDWGEERRAPRAAGATSGKAIAAFICGLASFCLSALAGIPALILGVISLGDISRSRPRMGGRGLAIAGIILGVVGTLMSGSLLLLIPAVQRIREASTRIQSAQNLKQLSLAMVNYSDVYNGRMPPSVVYGPDGKPLYSWRVLLLPYLEADYLYNQFHLDEPWDSPHNKPLLTQMPRCFVDPGRLDEPGMTHYQVFDGPGAPFDSSARPLQPFMLGGPKGALQLQVSSFQLRFPAGFTDGASNTILIVEAADAVPWSSPQDLAFGPGKPLPKLGQPSRKGFNAAYADGSVRFFSSSISEPTLRALITPNAGDVPGPDAR
jgi:prepilin-type processing-associated H-X9-DG protein